MNSRFFAGFKCMKVIPTATVHAKVQTRISCVTRWYFGHKLVVVKAPHFLVNKFLCAQCLCSPHPGVFVHLTIFITACLSVQQSASGCRVVEAKCCTFQHKQAHELLTNNTIILYLKWGDKFGLGLVTSSPKSENKMTPFSSHNYIIESKFCRFR